jgi:hypothetical protein
MGEGWGVLVAIVSSALGGTAAAVTRYLVVAADPITLAVLRWGIGFAVVLPVALLLRVKWPQRSDWLGVAALGLGFFGLFFVLYNLALSYTTAARASLALSTLPLQTMIVGALLGIEKVTARKSLGVGIAVLGVAAALASGVSAAPAGAWRGEAIMCGAVLCMAFYNVWSRPFMQRSSALGFLAVGTGGRGGGAHRGGSRDGPPGGIAGFRRASMDRGRLSRGRRRRARLHPLGARSPERKPDAGRQHHDRQPARRGSARDRARRRTDHDRPGRRPGRGLRGDLDRDHRRAVSAFQTRS